MEVHVTLHSISLIALACCASAFANDSDSRAKLIGKWQAPAEGSATAAEWSLRSDGDLMHISHSQGGRNIIDFECNTSAQECAAKESGRAVKISMWYNGPSLVLMEFRGSEVLKRRFSIPAGPDAMDLEIIPIVPDGKAETLHLRRVS